MQVKYFNIFHRCHISRQSFTILLCQKVVPKMFLRFFFSEKIFTGPNFATFLIYSSVMEICVFHESMYIYFLQQSVYSTVCTQIKFLASYVLFLEDCRGCNTNSKSDSFGIVVTQTAQRITLFHPTTVSWVRIPLGEHICTYNIYIYSSTVDFYQILFERN